MAERLRTAWDHTPLPLETLGGIAPNNAMNRPGEYFVFDFSTYRDTLTLTPVEGQISPLNFRAKPWRRLAETASTEHFSKHCPPPEAALNR